MELLNIKKIGPKTLSLLNKINIFSIEDLITYYPFRYNIYRPVDLNKVDNLELVTINAVIETIPRIFFIKKNLNRLTFKAMANNLLFNVVIYNRAYLNSYLDVGKKITLVGKYNKLKNSFVASDLKSDWINNIKVEPIYHVVKGLKNNNLSGYIAEALNSDIKINDYIPEELSKKYSFMDKGEAISIIHNPTNINDLKKAKLRLIYEEFFIFMLKINYLKLKKDKIKGLKKDFDREKINEFITGLPFELTKDQLNAINDILIDLKSNTKMNRLIQGDTGSGKTIVAIVAMVANTLAGFQSALMAPTELLAFQHYNNIKELVKDYNINVGLLVGSQKKSVHNKLILDLKEGKIDIIVGTHSLISKDVEFKNLGLVITDEQHRFGVNQRSNLQNKGYRPDVIYLSATPIPRTYALTIYQDMDTSIIKTNPNGRRNINTVVKKESELKEVLLNVLEEIKNGHQIYVVSPSIEAIEDNDLKDLETLKNSFDKAFNKKVPIEILHGKLKGKEKDEIMNDFINGKIKILISTTVIEVGVDVKNATTIVIFNAEMFGLATLHQLRGRVGRNDFDSYCYLISNKDTERLKILEDSNDGFYISEQDFLMRREGDLFGTRQSGDMEFQLGNLQKDFKILLKAKEDSLSFLEKNELDEKYKSLLKSVSDID